MGRLWRKREREKNGAGVGEEREMEKKEVHAGVAACFKDYLQHSANIDDCGCRFYSLAVRVLH